MRGKEIETVPNSAVERITPAHAGKRIPQRCNSPGRWDHPRTCGEKTSAREVDFVTRGSPPHMRGKASCSRCGRWASGDHPRTCGEKFSMLQARLNVTGSPPHMRGKAAFGSALCAGVGITPAHAGKSAGTVRVKAV